MTLTRKQAEIRATILDELYAKRPLSRIDISKETGITPATTGSVINELIKANLVQELGELNDESVGRKKTLLDIVPGQRYYLGVEISEKYLALAITDNLGTILSSAHHPDWLTNKTLPSDAQITELIQTFLHAHKEFPITSIAFALPGHTQLKESCYIISNNPLWHDINLKQIQQAFDIPVLFGNKSHCLTLAERLFSYHTSDSNFIVFHVAHGIHCSYMYNGKVYSRDNFLIGEIGHTIINPEGERCSCGKMGCLQAYASEVALIRKATLLYHSSQISLLKTLAETADKINLKMLIAAYQLGDIGSIKLIDTACKYLSIAISNLYQLIDTEKIYLDGELFSHSIIAEQLLTRLQQMAQLFPKQKQPEIVIMPYSEINIARAATSLCVYHEFLDKNQI